MKTSVEKCLIVARLFLPVQWHHCCGRRGTRGVTHYMGLARGMRDLYWSQSQTGDKLKKLKLKLKILFWTQSWTGDTFWPRSNYFIIFSGKNFLHRIQGASSVMCFRQTISMLNINKRWKVKTTFQLSTSQQSIIYQLSGWVVVLNWCNFEPCKLVSLNCYKNSRIWKV